MRARFQNACITFTNCMLLLCVGAAHYAHHCNLMNFLEFSRQPPLVPQFPSCQPCFSRIDVIFVDYAP